MKPLRVLVHAALLTAIVLLGIYLRAVAVQETRVDQPLRADAGDYVSYALNITKQGIYSRSRSAFRANPKPPEPDAVRPPGYPALLAMVMAVTPDRVEQSATLWIQVVLSLVTILLSWHLFRYVLPDSGALAAALLTALSPHLVIMNVYYLSETLYTLLLLGAMWSLVVLATRPKVVPALVTGIGFGVSALTRPAIQYFILIIAALTAWAQKASRGPLLAIVVIGGFLLVTTPWALRNLSTVGSFSNQTLMKDFIAHGMYPGFRYQDQDHTYAIPYRFDPKRKHYNRSVTTVLNELRRRVLNDPGRYVRWYLQKPLWLWQWGTVQGDGDIHIYPVYRSPYQELWIFQITRSFMKTLHIPLLLLALVGCVLPWLRSAKRGYQPQQLFLLRGISALLAYYTLIHIIGAPFPRYSVPLRPFVYGMALVTIHQLVLLIRPRLAAARRQ